MKKRTPKQVECDIATGTKLCTACNVRLSLSKFYKRKSALDGHGHICKVCHLVERRRWVKYNKKQNAKVNRKAHLKMNYGMTPSDYDNMLSDQDGKCKICGSTEPGGRGSYFHVDHDHKTQEVRGLLCNPCNVAIGYMMDDPIRLRMAADYLGGRR